MEQDIKQVVREKYTEVVTAGTGCCGPTCCSPATDTTFSESYEQLPGYVPEADYGLGCGLPTEHAGIHPGNTVLDLGSGAGNDVFVARSLVGPEGRVIGVDMTEAMVEKAKRNQQKLGYENVEFRLGDIEDLPLRDNAVDVVISNCVMNLVPDKDRAYAEVYRVLKPGGHFSISDIVLRGELTPTVRDAAALYAGCISGALQQEDYLQAIERAGFDRVEVVKQREISLPDELLLEYINEDELLNFRRSGSKVVSITVVGYK